MDYLTLAEVVVVHVVVVASAICALTPTPAPGTTLAKVYRVIEMAGLVVGRAKDRGLVPANPLADKLDADAVQVAKDVLGKTAVVLLLAGLTIGGLSACAQVQRGAEKVQPALLSACDTAMAMSSIAGPVAPYIVAGCGSAEAIDKLAADPSSTAWVDGLVGLVKGLKFS